MSKSWLLTMKAKKNNKIIVNDAIMNTKRKSITAIVIYITVLMKKTIGKFEKY